MKPQTRIIMKWVLRAILLGALTLPIILGYELMLNSLSKKSGFVLREIRIYDRERSDKQEVLDSLNLDIGMSLAAISPSKLRERLLTLRWVDDASVQRYWAGLLVVELQEHNPAALWQNGQTLVPISIDGTPIVTDGFTPFENLFHISGEEAPARLEELLQVIDHWQELRTHITQANLSPQNTWNITLRTGTKILLAPDPLVRNIVQLLRLERHFGILEAPPMIIDLRANDRASVRAISNDAKELVMKMRNER